MRRYTVTAKIYLCILCFFVITFCTSIGCREVRSGSSFLSKKEIKLLKQTTGALDYGYGFDSRLKLFYIFNRTNNDKNIIANKQQLNAIISNTPLRDIEALYCKILRVQAQLNIKTAWFKKMEDWRNYTHCKNYLSPGLDTFLDVMKNTIARRDAGFFEKDKVEREKSVRWAQWYYRYEHEAVDTF